jgi:hypothetical protein
MGMGMATGMATRIAMGMCMATETGMETGMDKDRSLYEYGRVIRTTYKLRQTRVERFRLHSK